jgi:glycosyltransferase involved in cell wall biosynthesis
MKPKITFISNMRNEERDLPALIRNIRGCADEIIILDGHSTDRTREVAQKLGAKVIWRKEIKRTSEYPFNRYIRMAKNNWIFNIDADERLSPELARALPRLVADPLFKAYRIPRKNFLKKGHWIRYGVFYPDYQMRLFHRDYIYFQKPIHTFPIIRGPLGTIGQHMLHLKYLRSAQRLEQQMAEWASGEPEVETNPLKRVVWFVILLNYYFLRDYLWRGSFREPDYLGYLWMTAIYFSKYPHKIKNAARSILPKCLHGLL